VWDFDKPTDSHNPKMVPQSFRDQTADLVPQSHISLDCGSGTSRDFGTDEDLDPLECPGVRMLLLSEAASRYLQEPGEDAFVIISMH